MTGGVEPESAYKEPARRALGMVWIRTSIRLLLPLVLITIIAEFGIRAGNLDRNLIPAPSDVLQRFIELAFVRDVLAQHLIRSLGRLVPGYVLAVVVGLGMGYVLGLNRRLRETVLPLVSFLMSIPTLAWVPVLLITTGLGESTVVIAVFLAGVFEITYAAADGIRSVNPHQLQAAQIMGTSGLRLFIKVLLPASLLSVIPVMRLCVGYSWRALVGAEMLAAMVQHGIGKMVYEARIWNDVRTMFVGLALIGIAGMLIDRGPLATLQQATLGRWGALGGRHT
jgi:NitT/TauT family transport system permease protein